jgi:hypothetical protein
LARDRAHGAAGPLHVGVEVVGGVVAVVLVDDVPEEHFHHPLVRPDAPGAAPIAVAAWVGCAGAAVAALAVTPATARPAVRATATATRCNFLMTSSFILGFGNL